MVPPWNPGERRGRRGARLTRRVREEPGELARVYFDRNPMSGAKRRGYRRLNIPEATPDEKLVRALPAMSPPASR